MIKRGIINFLDNFDRAQTLTTTPGMNGWTLKKTASGGSPTSLCITEDGGAMALTLAAASEAEILTMYMNDVLPLDLALLQRVEFLVKVAAIDSVTTLVFGVASAENDTPDSVTVNCWFKIDGTVSTSNVVVETDDNTTDNDDKATGQSLASTYKNFVIDFTNGLSDIRFLIDGQRVAGTTVFNMSAVTAGQNVQPYVQIQKASGTGVAAVTIKQVSTTQRLACGA